jgi:hypothetical protein
MPGSDAAVCRAPSERPGAVPARPAQSYCDGMRAGGPRMKEDTLLSLTVALAQESAECEVVIGLPMADTSA